MARYFPAIRRRDGSLESISSQGPWTLMCEAQDEAATVLLKHYVVGVPWNVGDELVIVRVEGDLVVRKYDTRCGWQHAAS
jgi:hypothetical protein